MRALIVTTLLLAVSCGPRIDDKKSPPPGNNQNNTTQNNTQNNTAGNNTTGTNQNNTTSTNQNNTVMPNLCASVSPEALNFGVVEVGQSAQASVTLENCSAESSLELLGVESNTPFGVSLPNTTTLDTLQSLTIPVTFAPTSMGAFEEELIFRTDFGDLAVAVQGATPPDEECPTAVATVSDQPGGGGIGAVTVTAGTTVYLDASASTSADGSELLYQWSFISKPASSTAQLSPDNDVARPQLFVDAPGTYEILLEAFTTESADECPDARVAITAEPGDGSGQIRVEMTWDTPADTDQTDAVGTDVDLHYLHPSGQWNTSPWDCFWQNINADWGADGRAEVELDDTDGAGPERIVHNSPGPRSYNVGVYYYADNGLGASYATVRVFLDGQLAYELKDQFLSAANAFLYNIIVDWPNRTVTDTNLRTDMGFP